MGIPSTYKQNKRGLCVHDVWTRNMSDTCHIMHAYK